MGTVGGVNKLVTQQMTTSLLSHEKLRLSAVSTCSSTNATVLDIWHQDYNTLLRHAFTFILVIIHLLNADVASGFPLHKNAAVDTYKTHPYSVCHEKTKPLEITNHFLPS